MAVPSQTSAVRYTGNGSTETAYTIPFPFLDTAHIYAAVSTDGVTAAVLLEPEEYTVTRLSDGTGGSLVTVAAVEDPAEIVIFRSLPVTQPTVYQPAGPFPAKTTETALDRLLMQIQQLNRRVNELEGVSDEDYIFVPGGDTADSFGVAIWADATARGAKKPARSGQLGVEISTQTVWIAQSTTTGDWEEFAKRYSNKLVIGLIADGGDPGDYQSAAADALTDWDVDAVIFAGDNNYNGAAAYDTDWAAFLAFINAGTAYPALGNHDMDEAGWETRLATKFPYLPNNRRYYNVELGDGLVELFVLNSGRDSLWDLVEEDGNDVGSVQHAWFVEALAASKARWKIAVFHHPPASLSGDLTNEIEPNMAWPELGQCHLVCCGHSHLLEILKWKDTQLVNLSALVRVDGGVAATIQGGEVADSPLWANETQRALGRIVASQDKLTVEVWALDLPYGGRRLLHARDARNLSRVPLSTETYSPFNTDVTISTGTRFVTQLGEAMSIIRVRVTSTGGDTGASYEWTLLAGAVEMATGTTSVDELSVEVESAFPDSIVPRETIIRLEVVTDGFISGLELQLTVQKLQ